MSATATEDGSSIGVLGGQPAIPPPRTAISNRSAPAATRAVRAGRGAAGIRATAELVGIVKRYQGFYVISVDHRCYVRGGARNGTRVQGLASKADMAERAPSL